MKITPENVMPYVNHGDEMIAALARAYLTLWAANRDLYYAAYWEADRPVEKPELLWENVRNACGFPEGHSPKKIRPLQPLPLNGGEDYTSTDKDK